MSGKKWSADCVKCKCKKTFIVHLNIVRENFSFGYTVLPVHNIY